MIFDDFSGFSRSGRFRIAPQPSGMNSTQNFASTQVLEVPKTLFFVENHQFCLEFGPRPSKTPSFTIGFPIVNDAFPQDSIGVTPTKKKYFLKQNFKNPRSTSQITCFHPILSNLQLQRPTESIQTILSSFRFQKILGAPLGASISQWGQSKSLQN